MNDVKQPLTHRQRQALATQQMIVDAARSLFLEQGYGVTTIDAISAKAGVAVRFILLFRSKFTMACEQQGFYYSCYCNAGRENKSCYSTGRTET